MVNGIVSLISLLDILLLVYRNATNFCMLILYPAPLPDSLISSHSFLVPSLDFPCKISCHVQTVIVLLSFQSGFLLFLSSLITMVMTSKTMLNKNGKSGHPCFISDLTGNAISFSPFDMILTMGLSYMAFIY